MQHNDKEQLEKTLGEYVLQNPCIEKRQLFSWITQILVQLQAIELLEGVPNSVTPFHMTVRGNQTVVIGEKNSTDYSSVLKKFLPDEGQNSSIYSFGKTIQFLLAKSDLTPKLTRREETRFKKIISKCLTNNSKKQYQRFSDISIHFPKRKIFLSGIAIAFVLGVIQMNIYYVGQNAEKMEEEQLYFDMGVSSFLILQDYKASKELFDKIENQELAFYFREMASYMEGTSEYTDFEMELVLNEVVKLAEEQMKVSEKACLVRVYEKVNTPNARKQIAILGEKVLEEVSWNETRREVREILANVYLREGEYEKALREYEILLKESDYEEVCKIIKDLKKKTQ